VSCPPNIKFFSDTQ